jgi:very-short-patch-repair endonuclease
MNYCKCGCGAIVAKNYKKGHGRRGRKNSKEHNAAISKHNKGKKLSKERIEYLRSMSIGRKLTDEQKQFLSKKAKQLGFGKWMKGRKLSSETIQKLKNRKRPCSEKTKKKISKANSGENNGMFGKKHTEEVKNKISKASINMWNFKREELIASANSPEKKEKLKKARLNTVFPKKDSKPEVLIQVFLNELKIHYKKHYVISIPSAYQVDIYIPEYNLVMEVDGIYWHNYPFLREIDIKRNKEMLEKGFKVLRFWEHEVFKITCAQDLKQIILSLDKSILNLRPLPKQYERFRNKYGIS